MGGVVTYYVHGGPPGAASEIQRCLDDKRGWRGQGIRFRLTQQSRASIVVKFLRNVDIVRQYGNRFDGLSVCDTRSFPTAIAFNLNNWFFPPVPWHSRRRYRQYLIQHEFGHAIGRGHVRAERGRCPVMHPQSRAPTCPAPTCRVNAWQ